MKDIINGLSTEEAKKLSEILAVMQKLSETEQNEILHRENVRKKAENIQLPEKPKSFILRSIRNKQEKKIAKCDEKIKTLKGKIKNKEAKINKIKKKITRSEKRIAKLEAANKFIENNLPDGAMKDFLLEQNQKKIDRISNSIDKKIEKISEIGEKHKNLVTQIAAQEALKQKAIDKINRINDVQDLPNAPFLFFLAEKAARDEELLEKDNYEDYEFDDFDNEQSKLREEFNKKETEENSEKSTEKKDGYTMPPPPPPKEDEKTTEKTEEKTDEKTAEKSEKTEKKTDEKTAEKSEKSEEKYTMPPPPPQDYYENLEPPSESFVLPPNFEYEEIPIFPENTEKSAEKTDNKNTEKFSENDDLGKIEISKEQLKELLPQLKELKENGTIIVKKSENSDKFDIYFKKENQNAVEKIINAAQKKSNSQAV